MVEVEVADEKNQFSWFHLASYIYLLTGEFHQLLNLLG